MFLRALESVSAVAKRLTSHALGAPRACLPAANASDVATDPAVVTLTRKAPTATAATTRGPEEKKRRERNAGCGPHRGGARVNEAKWSPSLPARA